MNMPREIFNVPEDEIDDFSKTSGSWEINGKVYNFVETFLSNYCDGECHEVIVQRVGDDKYFQFGWSYYHDNYYYEPQWEEVKANVQTIITYGWNEKGK